MVTARIQSILVAAVLALVQWTAPVSAQVPLPRAAGTEEQAVGDNVMFPHLSFDRITGMTKGAVTAIVQDGAGYIWFGTEEGLSRYDGYEFVNYTVGSDPADSLSNSTVNALAVDKDSLWVGTEKGLDRLNLATTKFTHLKTNAHDSSTIASDYIVSLQVGQNGLLWIGTSDAGVDSLNPATNEIKHYRNNPNRGDSLNDDGVSFVLQDKDGKVWIGTREAGVNRLDPATQKVTRFTHDPEKLTTLSNDQVTSIYQDAAGAMWIGTIDGLNRFDPATGTFTRYLSNGAEAKWITTIVEGVDGGLWLGVKDMGVFRLDRRSGTVERYKHDGNDETSITHPWPEIAFSDRGGVLWIGFHAGGVSKLPLIRREFAYYRGDAGLAFLEEGDQVWIGTQGKGLRSLNLKTGAVQRYLDDQLSATWTTKIIAGDKGSLWLGTYDKGVLHFTPSTGILETYDTETALLGSNTVLSLLREGDTMWIATSGAGLVRLDTKVKTLATFKSDANNPSTLSNDFVNALFQDRTSSDVLWVGTSGGLNEVNKRNGKVVRFVHDPKKPSSLSNDHVTDIHEDHAGRLWITTYGGGLDLLDRKTGLFKAYQVAQGLPNDVLYGILEDKAGMLWLTSDDGLSKFDPDKETAVNFRAGDGLQGDEFGQGAFHQGASGRFYVGGPTGFNVFIPEQLKVDTYAPPMVLTKFEVNGESGSIPTKVSLSFRVRLWSVSFAALDYASPGRNRYKYRLKGYSDWQEKGSDHRFADYTTLPPGDYTLEILGSNAHGVWNTEGIKLPIHVRPPPWKTWWAYTSYCLVFALIVGLLINRQRGQLDALRDAHRLSALEREMALTSAVQEGFFPIQPSVRDGNFRLEGFYRSATECSGDWWWYEPRADNYFIVVGDVTGHGAGSAMVTAAAASCFRSLQMRVDDDTRLREMNEEVLRVSRGQYHMTLTAMRVNVATGEFVIWSAGGLPVFTMPPGGRIKVHMCPGMPLGSADCEIGRLEGVLAPGERVLIMTDGIPEVAMANDQFIGPRGVSNFYMQTREQELKSALQQLIKKVESVQAGAQDDDWTAVMVEWGDSSGY